MSIFNFDDEFVRDIIYYMESLQIIFLQSNQYSLYNLIWYVTLVAMFGITKLTPYHV